ncbi:MAG: prolyl oligopeptidase family serine peptidase [Candidatus Latescibacteria bacterium]|nr:prolyl oligopeptidase family serine peptidase [Candidatus Latescibacterota bacterium]
MSAAETRLHLSPSEFHRHLLERTVPKLRYEGDEVAAWQRRLRTRLCRLIGEWPARRVPLRSRRLWLRPHPLGTIEKVVFTAEPHCEVPAYVCLPAGAEPPYTFMICLQGHSTGMHVSIGAQREDETKPYTAPGDRDFAIGCMQREIAALCIEQRSLGERREQRQQALSPHGCHDATVQALMLGRTLIGERVYDVDRGIDYLASRGDADMNRLGVMGNSGGGTTALFAAALLKRLAFAMPSCYFCTFADSLMSIYHCADNYVPGLLQWAEMADVMGLFAPRPVVLVAGAEDPIFPIAGARKAYRQLQRIYRAAGAVDRCHLVVGQGGHRFYAEDAWPVMLEELARLGGKKGRGRN